MMVIGDSQGEWLSAVPEGDGYVTIERPWRPGERLVIEWDSPARIVLPHPQADAVRGCVAVERGPVVYCFEGVDQDPGVDLNDVELVAGQGIQEIPSPVPGLAPELRLSGLGGRTTVDTPDPADEAWRTVASGSPNQAVKLSAIPYARWANRSPSTMRVWIPEARNGSINE
jgi:DUF1680 family protein